MASRLAHSDKVALRIEELKTEIADACLWSREQSVMVLAGIAGTGDSKVKPSEKTAAVKELNAMHGFNAPTKVGLEHSGVVKTILEPAEDFLRVRREEEIHL